MLILIGAECMYNNNDDDDDDRVNCVAVGTWAGEGRYGEGG